MIKTGLLCGLWLFIIPIILGLGILKFNSKKNKNLLLALIIGIFVELLFFEALSVPMTFAKCSFTQLQDYWMIIMIVLSIISLLFNIKDAKEIVKQNFEGLKTTPKILTIVFLVLLTIQFYHPFKYMHQDNDDSNFVAKSTIAIDTDSLFVYDDAGNEYKSFPTRTVLSQFPHFTAVISQLIDIHPTILAHTIYPVVFICIAYACYYLLGMTMFKNDKNKTMTFLIVLSVVFMYGAYSRYTNFMRLLLRIWQGKSLVANLTLPFIWYIFMEYIGKENSKFGWFILFITLAGSIAFSSMALILPTITVLLLMVIYAIKDRKIIYIISILICCIPCAILASVYLKMDNPVVKNSALLDDELTIEEKVDAVLDEEKDEKALKTIEEAFGWAGGNSYYMPLFVVSMLFAWAVCKKDRNDVAAIFGVFSLLIFIMNFNVVFAKLWNMAFGSGVYWRVYWLLPIGYSIAFMITELIFKADGFFGKAIALLLACFVITFCGSSMYESTHYHSVGNYYKIPDLALDVIFHVSEDNNDYKKIGGPSVFSVYTRCVDGTILLAQPRVVGESYSKNSIVKLVEEGDSKKIFNYAVKQKCNYVVVEKRTLNLEDPLTNYGFKVLHENDGYVLYKLNLEEVEVEVKK